MNLRPNPLQGLSPHPHSLGKANRKVPSMPGKERTKGEEKAAGQALRAAPQGQQRGERKCRHLEKAEPGARKEGGAGRCWVLASPQLGSLCSLGNQIPLSISES